MSGRIRWFAVRVPIGLAGLTLLLAGCGIVRVDPIVVLLLAPVLLFRVGLCVWHGVRVVRRLVSRRAELRLQPSGPPIEQIAADLRGVLWRHDWFARSNDIVTSARRLPALEAAVSRYAL